ncbi:MAG TPA: ComF family protein [Woeseiaceae bacterium]|nr:ComF family protein [Woeseiaceae bacterium]
MYAAHAAAVPCAACQQRAPPWQACVAPLEYRFPVDAALKALKFRGRLDYAPAFAALLAPFVARRLAAVDALLPVPLHRLRHARRGYNQACEIGRPLARASGLPLVDLARRARATRPQSGLDRAARRHNLRGAFRLAAPPACRYPLILDDVMTTGETCRRLAQLLLDGGAERVAVLTVARAAASDYAAAAENV